MKRIVAGLSKKQFSQSRAAPLRRNLVSSRLCRTTYVSKAAFPSQFTSMGSMKFSTVSSPETREFKAETRKLLDIVTHSIYTDKEVFIRELISNASDSLEKFRYKQLIGEVSPSESPLEINIVVDKEKKTLSIADNGVGMTKDELINNLGTIARSGSKQFVESLSKPSGEGEGKSTNDTGIIGQFGVGFYSSFMVADRVSVESASALRTGEEQHASHKWSSDGSGVFTVEEIAQHPDLVRGSKITMHLKDDSLSFGELSQVKSIIQKYSNFVAFPIKLNGELVNSVSAIWTQDKKSVTPEQYNEFYRFITNAYDEPRFTLHFRSDAPIDLKCLFFVPTFHTEKFGQGRMAPGVNLYSRKVLIESKPQDLLPDWLRFIKGVVDSEDLPLSLSREKAQDSNLLRRIKDVLTRKLVRFFEEQARDQPEKYKEFYLEYNYFLKEGACHDFKYVEQISKLLMFESSAKGESELISLDDYISRCSPDQKNIYYIVAPSRTAALNSPYYETFKKHNQEVLFMYNTIDDFVMQNIKTHSGRTLTSAETSAVELDKTDNADKSNAAEETKSDDQSLSKLSETQGKEVCEWLTKQLGSSRVREVKVTHRLSDSPAIVTDHESGALRRMLRMVDQSNSGKTMTLPPQLLEINPKHPIILGLFQAMQASQGTGNGAVASLVAEQVFDNALIAAGLVDDPRIMLGRLNSILAEVIKK